MHPSFGMVLSPVLELPDVSVTLTSARVVPGTRRDKDKMKNEECVALMQPRHTAHAIIRECALDRSGRCHLETAASL